MDMKTNSPRAHRVAAEDEIARLAGLFQALADPARLRILNLLAHGGEVRNTEVEGVTGYGNSKISRHFAYLKHAGLIGDRRHGLSIHYALRAPRGLVSATLLQSVREWAAIYNVFERDAEALRKLRHGAADAGGADAHTGREPARKPKVLFLCQHNAARSQIAEAWLRHQGGTRFDAYSAGLTSTEIHPLTLQVLEEAGLPTAKLRSKGVQEFLGRMSFAYVITLCLEAEEACPCLFPGAAQLINWPFEDVATAPLAEAEKLHRFRLLRDSIDQKVRGWLKD